MRNQQKPIALVALGRNPKPLVGMLGDCGASVIEARTCHEVMQVLREKPQIDIVISQLSFEDGAWWTIRKELIAANSPASLVVCLPQADGGISDLLEAGCCAVLVPPYDRERVRRIVEAAPQRAA